MGADILFTTTSKPVFDTLILEMIQKDDAYFAERSKNNLYYFRDSYNRTNLASVLGLSYRKEYQKSGNLISKISFFRKMANITDRQIETFARDENNPGCNHASVILGETFQKEPIDEMYLIDLLKNKRDYLAAILAAGVLRIQGG